MKILMLLEDEFPPDVRVENEIKTLISGGHEVVMTCTTRKGLLSKDKYIGIVVYRFKLSKLLYKLRAFAIDLPFYYNFWTKNLNKLFKIEKFDAIHVHDLPLANIGLKFSKKHNLKFILDLHENRPEIMKLYNYTNTFPGNILISLKKWENYQKYASAKADKLILITEIAKQDYIKRYHLKTENVFSVPNWPNTGLLDSYSIDQSILKKYQSNFMLVYFGDTGARRGTLDIIEVANQLKNESQYHFVIIGNSREQHQLKAKIQEYKLTNIELTGYLPFSTIASYIKASKGGLCTFHKNLHHDTTYANKLFQLMYYAKPVIVSNCLAQEIIVNEESCGVVYEAGNIEALKQSIIKLHNLTESKFREMCLRGHQAVINKYHLEAGHHNLLNLYNSF